MVNKSGPGCNFLKKKIEMLFTGGKKTKEPQSETAPTEKLPATPWQELGTTPWERREGGTRRRGQQLRECGKGFLFMCIGLRQKQFRLMLF
jgi:hypothetical protein